MRNFELNDDQSLILDTVRKYVADAVEPKALEHDEHRVFARDEFAGLAELGVFALPVAESAGGVGMGLVPLVAALEAIGATSGSLARLLVQQVQCAVALESAGGQHLDDVLAGSKLAAFVGPEHGITANGGKLTGRAELVPGGGEAGLFVVAARSGAGTALFAVDPAQTSRTPVRALGLASTAPCRVTFEGVAATQLADGDAAAGAIARAHLVAWLGSAAASIGAGQGSCAGSERHAGERIAFGKPLLAQQAVARKLVESRRALDAARHQVWHAARLHDDGQDATDAAASARIAAVDAGVAAADEGIQIHGGFGYVVEYHVERHYRDCKTLEVLDGGSERLRDRLAASWLAKR